MPQQNRMTKLNPKANSYVVRKRKKKFTRKSVVKMLAVMEGSQAAGPSKSNEDAANPPQTVTSHDDFLQSGRTGRRNALADILGEHAAVTSSDLPSRLEGLTTKDSKLDSKSSNNEPNTAKS